MALVFYTPKKEKGGEKMDRKIFVILLVVAIVGGIALATSENAYAKRFTDEFMLEECGGFSNTGSNPFFNLNPGYLLVLEGQEGRKTLRVTITVLDELRTVTVDIGGVPTAVDTRVIEERETKDDVLVEISRNYFAICNRTNSVMYFGEAVDIYDKTGETVISHEGAWEVGVDEGAMPGIMMPGTILKGGKYFQEVAPGIAMDRAEVVNTNSTVETPFGTFTDCLKTRETTPLEPGEVDFKFYAPGVGLIKDGPAKLIGYGFPAR